MTPQGSPGGLIHGTVPLFEEAPLPGFSLRALSIRAGLMISAGIALLVAVVVGGFGISRTQAIADKAEDLYGQQLRPLAVVKDIQQLIWHGRWASLSGLTATDTTKATAYNEEAAANYDLVSTRIEEYNAFSLTSDQRAAMSTFQTGWANYLELRQQSSALKKAGKLAEWAEFRSSTLNPALAGSITTLDDLAASSESLAAAAAAQAQTTAAQAAAAIAVVLIVGVVLAAAFAAVVARITNQRIRALREVVTAMADGDLAERDEDLAANEIGEMSRAVHLAVARTRDTIDAVASISISLSARSSELDQASRDLAASTDQASHQVGTIDAAAGEVSAGVQAVASGAEQMGAAIREISISATEAAGVASQAVEVAADAKLTMQKLDASSGEIDGVVKTITAIAEQTNLLALNATIEAARAGETGKGFAVVAGEVKDLAQETAKATEEISRRMEVIQTDTRVAVESISGIGEIIERINDYQNTIASAVEEQSATTQNMTGDLNRAAGGTSEITGGLSQVVQVTMTTREAAQAAEVSANDLAESSRRLRELVSQFSY
ncbi:hypothetical protein Acsp01_00360 [Actinoplanes sp. NBRC 101535]|nr:hypothetical protein Acsp01_00360 [Actinoplanes sp. NBRC 101535]